MSAKEKGSFEYLEAKIRRDAEGTLFGSDFEWICQWFLENAPLYRGKFRRVWRWADWPDRWGPDCGIDLIAETRDGHLWAVQSKAFSPEHSVTKAEIDSFLSESNHRDISFRLLIATTDKIGTNAKRTIQQQEKPASFVGRGDLLTADLAWPIKIGGKSPRPKKAKARPHQRAAISAVARGFREHNRGRLIMACGTGKTLTGLWIHERLESRRTLLLVPSISLAQQNLREWGKHAKEDFDCLVVCSDESVATAGDDPALRYVSEIGTDVTTDPAGIAAFLSKRRRRPAVVISTYHSSDRVAAAQQKARKTFDLALCDEAHRLVGDVQGKFATVLDDKKVRCRRRLFMTATPRYFTDRAKRKAADAEVEVASMDDETLFGPEFHILSFSDAINAKPTPLLTDYRVVVIGVTDTEAKQWVDEGKLVRTKAGATTDARTLATQIGLAKAIRDYDLRRVITFHRSIRRASQFADPQNQQSLPSVIATLRPSSRPSGTLWSRHISGETPASQRASLLRTLADLPADTRGVVANCACLGEGVDVPSLDGIAFIDPKGSMVDIIQAVGRVIRLARDKNVGTIVIPVFIDDAGAPEQTLQQSQFAPVWAVLKALRAHDQRLADELDSLRTQIRNGSHRINLPSTIHVDLPTQLPSGFASAFYSRVVTNSSEKPKLSIDLILSWADTFKKETGNWPSRSTSGGPADDETWGALDMALKNGSRGLLGGQSLASLLAAERGARNKTSIPNISIDQVLEMIDAHYIENGDWPHRNSGLIPQKQENWANIEQCLRLGLRGLPKGLSIGRLLAEHRGVYTRTSLMPDTTEDEILHLADKFRKSNGYYPSATTAEEAEPGISWGAIDSALRAGARGLKGGSSLWALLKTNRGLKKTTRSRDLTETLILAMADEFHKKTGRWPDQNSGHIEGTQENWKSIDVALQKGYRSLPGKSSVARLLEEHGRKSNAANKPPLTDSLVYEYIKAYVAEHGKFPTKRSGSIPGTQETFSSMDQALRSGLRGITEKSSLSRFIIRHFGEQGRTIETMREIAAARGGRCLSPEFQGMNNHLEWQCGICGEAWSATPKNVIHNRSWCPKCRLPKLSRELSSSDGQ